MPDYQENTRERLRYILVYKEEPSSRILRIVIRIPMMFQKPKKKKKKYTRVGLSSKIQGSTCSITRLPEYKE